MKVTTTTTVRVCTTEWCAVAAIFREPQGAGFEPKHPPMTDDDLWCDDCQIALCGVLGIDPSALDAAAVKDVLS